MPDVILIYLGTNDWANGVDLCKFEDGYAMMLRQICENYKNAEIWCCTLHSSYISDSNFIFPEKCAGISFKEYNKVIRKVVEKHQCKLIDFEKYKFSYNSIDGSHPNEQGMETIAEIVIREMFKKSKLLNSKTSFLQRIKKILK